MAHEIRKVLKQDIAGLKVILNSIDLFPADMLDDMISDYFNNPESEDIWFGCIEDGKPVAMAYCAPEKLTEGTYNLYALGILNTHQGKRIGQGMMTFIESLLRDAGHRVLIVDTSSSPDYEPARKFYKKCGYTEEAVIRDFWEEGDDKITFWKKLN